MPEPTRRRDPVSPYDPTGIDDGKGGIPIGARRPALKAPAWISLVVIAIAIAAQVLQLRGAAHAAHPVRGEALA